MDLYDTLLDEARSRPTRAEEQRAELLLRLVQESRQTRRHIVWAIAVATVSMIVCMLVVSGMVTRALMLEHEETQRAVAHVATSLR